MKLQYSPGKGKFGFGSQQKTGQVYFEAIYLKELLIDNRCGMKEESKVSSLYNDEQKGYLWVGEYLGRRSLGMKTRV